MKKIIIGIVIALIVLAFFSGSYYIRFKADRQQKCERLGFQNTAIQITQTGNIPIVVNNTIEWFPISNFCGG